MTPGYYLIAQAAMLLPGDSELTLRLPSIAGYGMALVGVYCIVRKRYPSVAGLAAVLLMTTTPLRDYAIEARCYALLVGCFAVSAALWQRVEERRYAGFFLGVFLTIAVALHYLAVLMLAVFGAAELMWVLGVRRSFGACLRRAVSLARPRRSWPLRCCSGVGRARSSRPCSRFRRPG